MGCEASRGKSTSSQMRAEKQVKEPMLLFFGNHGLGEEDIYLHADNCQYMNNLKVKIHDVEDSYRLAEHSPSPS